MPEPAKTDTPSGPFAGAAEPFVSADWPPCHRTEFVLYRADSSAETIRNSLGIRLRALHQFIEYFSGILKRRSLRKCLQHREPEGDCACSAQGWFQRRVVSAQQSFEEGRRAEPPSSSRISEPYRVR